MAKQLNNRQMLRKLVNNTGDIELSLIRTALETWANAYPDNEETRRLFASMVGENSFFHPSFVEYYIDAANEIRKTFPSG